MKKFILSLFVVFSFIFYSVNDRSKQQTVLGETLPASSNINSPPIPTNFPNQPSGMQSMHQGQMTGMMTDGQYKGDVVDAYYGNVQVLLTVQGGKISDVQFLNYPQDRRTSVYINSQAIPILRRETIQNQSANVNIVTGATATSRAFIESLRSALAKAQS